MPEFDQNNPTYKECKECQHAFIVDDSNEALWNYCPQCGKGLTIGDFNEWSKLEDEADQEDGLHDV